MAGWLSAHSLAERPWTHADTAALDAAKARVTSLLRKLTPGTASLALPGPIPSGSGSSL